jgi:proteic killer suppression protein
LRVTREPVERPAVSRVYKGDRAVQHSIRINQQYRICFRWEKDGAADVGVTKHYE